MTVSAYFLLRYNVASICIVVCCYNTLMIFSFTLFCIYATYVRILYNNTHLRTPHKKD